MKWSGRVWGPRFLCLGGEGGLGLGLNRDVSRGRAAFLMVLGQHAQGLTRQTRKDETS